MTLSVSPSRYNVRMTPLGNDGALPIPNYIISVCFLHFICPFVYLRHLRLLVFCFAGISSQCGFQFVFTLRLCQTCGVTSVHNNWDNNNNMYC